MKNTKAFRLFSSIVQMANDMKELEWFFGKPSIRENTLISELFDIFKQYLKHPNDNGFTNEEVFNRLFSSKEFNEKSLRNLCSRFCGILEDYLVYNLSINNPVYSNFLTSKFYQTKINFEFSFLHKIDTIIKGNLPDSEAEKALILAQSVNPIVFYPKKSVRNKAKYSNYLDLEWQNNLIYWKISGLKYFCEKLFRFQTRGEELDDNFYLELEKLMSFITKEDISLIRAFYLTILFYKEKNQTNYKTLKDYFINNFETIHSNQRFIFTGLFNGLISLAHPHRLEELLELQLFGLENGLFVENGIIDEEHYSNIVRIFCKMNQVELAKEFVETHTPFLDVDKKRKKSIQARVACHIAFANSDFEEVLAQANEIKLQERPYMVDRYLFSLMASCELGDMENFYKKERGFREYINNSKGMQELGKEYKTSYKNFLKLVIYIVESPYKSYSKDYLLGTLTACNGFIAESKWLKKKINLL